MAAEQSRSEGTADDSKPARQPRLPGGRKHKYTVRLSDKEEMRIRARAMVAGVSVPRFLVEAALAGDARTAGERRAIVIEILGTRQLLAQISNNIDQLAKVATAFDEPPPELAATLHATARVLTRLDAATTNLTNPPY